MAIIKKTDKVKITYDQKKIVLKSETITMEVDMNMSALLQIYSSGSGEGKAVYSVKIPDAPKPIVAPVVAAAPAVVAAALPSSNSFIEAAPATPAPAAPAISVPIPADPKPDPITQEVPIIIVESDKDAEPVEAPVTVSSEPVENIDDIIREADGEVPATSTSAPASSPEPALEPEPDATPVIEEDTSGWETVPEEPEADTSEEVTKESPDSTEEDEPREKKYRGFASKEGWIDTP